jgi:uncharacterized metal-binding protein
MAKSSFNLISGLDAILGLDAMNRASMGFVLLPADFMPSGRTHDSITLWCLPIVAIVTWLMTQDGGLALILAGCFLFSGLMFGPDLDIHSQQYKRWGWLRWIWLPYRASMSHRSVLSHGPVIGTVLRILYLLTVVVTVGGFGLLGWAIAQESLGQVERWEAVMEPIVQQVGAIGQQALSQHWMSAIAAFLGLELGAMSHSLSDWLGSGWKQWRKRGRR